MKFSNYELNTICQCLSDSLNYKAPEDLDLDIRWRLLLKIKENYNSNILHRLSNFFNRVESFLDSYGLIVSISVSISILILYYFSLIILHLFGFIQ